MKEDRTMNGLRTCLLAGCLALAVGSCGGDDAHGGGDTLTAPAELRAVPVAGPAMHVTWKDIASEHHFSVERKEGSGQYVEVTTTLLNVTQYHDVDVTPGKSYTYRVAGAHSDLTKGPFSAEVTATIP
jgi:hypothetical protein